MTETTVAQHTPGPWAVEYVVDGAFAIIAGGGGDQLVIAQRSQFPRRHLEFVANARLIAATPDLYEALQAAEQFLMPGIDRGPAIDGWANTIEMVRAAIKKAEGRTPRA